MTSMSWSYILFESDGWVWVGSVSLGLSAGNSKDLLRAQEAKPGNYIYIAINMINNTEMMWNYSTGSSLVQAGRQTAPTIQLSVCQCVLCVVHYHALAVWLTRHILRGLHFILLIHILHYTVKKNNIKVLDYFFLG